MTTRNGGTKPIYLPAPEHDPVSHSIADTLFWTDQMAEHASFFVMLMPGRELAGPRARAEQFQAASPARWRRPGPPASTENYVAFNRATVEMTKRFVDFKREMQTEQESGTLRSLVWPLFFDHTAREGERFVRRLDQLSKGDADLDAAEVVEFWARIMDEHAEFIAHLLDPQEDALIEKALRQQRGVPRAAGEEGVEGRADRRQGHHRLQDRGRKGNHAGQIKSIIPPALADHVRREAVKFEDELKRAA